LTRREWLGAAGALLCTGSGGAKDNQGQQVADLVSKARTKHELAAVLCGVWKGNETILTDARGESMTGVPATTDMHLRVGGVAYTCVGMVLLRLAEKRRLSLDDPLSRWYPKLPQAAAVTLRMLANCTSGYPDYVRSPAFIAELVKNPFRQWRPQELIDFGLAKPPQYMPATDWNYSHTNFVLLGEILQQVGEKSIHALLDQEIFKPLGLTQTESLTTAELRSPALHALSTDRGIYEDCTFWSPSWAYPAQMTSTLHDLGTLARALGTDRLLSAKARAEQIAPATVGLGPLQKNFYYGLGVMLLNGWLVQNPQIGGYNLIFAYLPSRRLSVVIAATMGPKSPPDVHFSTLIFKNLVKILAPEALIPEAFR
jgi:CubicO group peptidase (beta-lactamase class C family)